MSDLRVCGAVPREISVPFEAPEETTEKMARDNNPCYASIPVVPAIDAIPQNAQICTPETPLLQYNNQKYKYNDQNQYDGQLHIIFRFPGHCSEILPCFIQSCLMPIHMPFNLI